MAVLKSCMASVSSIGIGNSAGRREPSELEGKAIRLKELRRVWAALKAEGEANAFVVFFITLLLFAGGLMFFFYWFLGWADLGVIPRIVLAMSQLGGLVVGVKWTYLLLVRAPLRIARRLEPATESMVDQYLEFLRRRLKKHPSSPTRSDS